MRIINDICAQIIIQIKIAYYLLLWSINYQVVKIVNIIK